MRGCTFRDLRLSDRKVEILWALGHSRQPRCPHQNTITALVNQGLVVMIRGELQLTDLGRPYAEEICRLYARQPTG